MGNTAISIEKSQAPADLKSTIVFVKRFILKTVLSKELGRCGLTEVIHTESEQEVLDKLADYPKALLVIDWEHGERSVVKILQAAQGRYKVDTRPIYLLASSLSPKLLGIASDYNIIQLHIGEISAKNIQDEIKIITDFGYQSLFCHKTFSQVARLRSDDSWKPAEKLLRDLVVIEPRNQQASLELAENLYETGDYVDAAEITAKVVAADPSNLRGRHLLARTMMKQGDMENALAMLEQVCAEGTLNLDRLVDLGRCLIKVDRIAEAVEKFDEALKLDILSKEALLGKSECALLVGNINEAVYLMRQVANEKEVASIFNNIAIMCMRKRRFEKGLQLYKAAISHIGKSPHVLARVTFNMGIGYLKWGKLKKAQLAFESASQLDLGFEKAKHNAELLKSYHLKRKVAEGAPDTKPKKDLASPTGGEEIKDKTLPSSAATIKSDRPSHDGASALPRADEGAPKREAPEITLPSDPAAKAKLDDAVAAELFDELDDSFFQNLVED